ncbi:penicillin-insensitive murein endopeptidase [Vibrio ichthyoenteri ATCC 700023]|uniref:Penicillin-insensitive murein endopeptidase n=1 Tax=Vibrio ichthyoenteri ATCC 700023 TaxID=870968 RepID=F9RW77_9VIBR|nr:penicillin-insensitive murein endopeptidase [Vibrio ichthyoenteri]EGU49330.1 penicillin-insensitive murein endopeptidase [Vibrio ichthyoenteri ATCC 700023]
MKAIRLGLVASILSLSLFSPLQASPWESLALPNRLSPESIGSYANGCLFGAQALPLNGQGYQVLRSQNKRYYAHPDTINFVTQLGQQARNDLRTHLLIGDMSLPQGGRFSSGHSSHQTGLDIDIWFRLADTKLSLNALKLPKPHSLVDMPAYKLIDKNWDNRHFRLVKMAAQDEQVARIFVHPVIKEKLCSTEGGDRDWLRKVRPWWGHNYHMHVRLKCPSGDTHCVNQAPPPAGDGCGKEVASWQPKHNVKSLRPETKPAAQPKPKVVKTKPKTKKIMPQQCQQIVRNLK